MVLFQLGQDVAAARRNSSMCLLQVHNERQKLHSDHKRLFEEEFSKYMRATKVNRSISVQIVMAPKEAMKRLRNPPNLFAAMLDRDNSESLP